MPFSVAELDMLCTLEITKTIIVSWDYLLLEYIQILQLSKTVGNVYATDSILATLMCATRSNYSWDIVVHKIGDKLFFDKRDNTFG